VAFIETAWRRYTKHSRNKAQEIQGAILPLVETHRGSAPFVGVILAGVFTEGALNQLKSLGFVVVYFPYERIIRAFRRVGIDAASSENSPDAEFAEKVEAWESLAITKRISVAKAVIRASKHDLRDFMTKLEQAALRRILSVRILALHGVTSDFTSVEAAIAFVRDYEKGEGIKPIVGYEIQIRYSNGDRIDGRFADKTAAIGFLASYQNGQG